MVLTHLPHPHSLSRHRGVVIALISVKYVKALFHPGVPTSLGHNINRSD